MASNKKVKNFLKENTYFDIALLIIRIGIGVMFVFHGIPKMLGGVEMWKLLGVAMSDIGIDDYPALWGFIAAFAEIFGGVFLIIGLFSRFFAILLFTTMMVASVHHLLIGDGLL